MPRGSGYSCSVCPLDAGDFAEQRSAVFIDYHYAILPCDKQAVIGRVGHNVVPTSISAQRVGVGHVVCGGRLPVECD